MKLFPALLSLTMIGGLSGVAFAQDNTTSPAPPAKPIKEKKTCRRQEVTGSMLGSTVCHTAAQWNSIDEQKSQNTEVLRNRTSQHAQ